MTPLTLIGLQVGLPRTIGDVAAVEPMDREWTTGFFKDPVEGSRRVGKEGIEGDGQADLINHGGCDKAINVYPVEHYAVWEKELGLAWGPGAFGENFTTRGYMETEVCVGDVFGLGELVMQVSQPRQPCWKLARRWRIKDLAAQVERTGRTGWYFRVLHEGEIRAGATLELRERFSPHWTISAANDVMHHCKDDLGASRELAACVGLSESWRQSLSRRVSGGGLDTNARLSQS